MKEPLYIIKIGGNIIDDEASLQQFLRSFASIGGHKILVHGGGKLATRMADAMKIPQQMVDGRRITDEATLRIVTMVYAGYINKQIVAGLQQHGANALGLSGADGDVVRAHKRVHATIDYGFAGDVDQVNNALLHRLLQDGVVPVLAPITHDGQGQLLNTNADTIAQETATSMAGIYDTVLVYTFEKAGVLRDVNDDASVIGVIDNAAYTRLKEENVIHSGMLPKMENAFRAIGKGVSKVVIGKASALPDLLTGVAGTTIIHEA